jgi:phospholipid N-methyltransferase
MMVRAARVRSADFVLEIGPGSGAFTGPILNNLRPEARFLAVEKCPVLAKTVSEKFPDAHIVAGCATDLTGHLKDHGNPDSIVSGLPWAAFDDHLQNSLLGEITSSIAKDGIFATFAYFGPHRLKAGRAFRKKLDHHFGEVGKTPVVLANLPPAFVYFCRR